MGGANSNVQDRTVITESIKPLSSDHDGSTIVGHFVTIGHSCFLRACTIEDECLVGMKSILCEGSYMERFSILGAGSVLMPHQRVPTGELWLGNPAKYVRDLNEAEKHFIRYLAMKYVLHGEEHNEELYYFPYSTAY